MQAVDDANSIKNSLWLLMPIHLSKNKQWWSKRWQQCSHNLQCFFGLLITNWQLSQKVFSRLISFGFNVSLFMFVRNKSFNSNSVPSSLILFFLENPINREKEGMK